VQGIAKEDTEMTSTYKDDQCHWCESKPQRAYRLKCIRVATMNTNLAKTSHDEDTGNWSLCSVHGTVQHSSKGAAAVMRQWFHAGCIRTESRVWRNVCTPCSEQHYSWELKCGRNLHVHWWMVDWIRKTWYIHTMECYSALKREFLRQSHYVGQAVLELTILLP
jgi:hypothetical protein